MMKYFKIHEKLKLKSNLQNFKTKPLLNLQNAFTRNEPFNLNKIFFEIFSKTLKFKLCMDFKIFHHNWFSSVISYFLLRCTIFYSFSTNFGALYTVCGVIFAEKIEFFVIGFLYAWMVFERITWFDRSTVSFFIVVIRLVLLLYTPCDRRWQWI